ncbi:MAG: ABC transporter substrate-binding protein [Actinomycetota bacterium]|nr:ABC transporter substrate-binding protein [Actinomycetota bacterium]
MAARSRRIGFLCLLLAALLLLCVLAAGCAKKKKSAAPGGKSGCVKGQLQTVKKGKLTVATDNPAFPPWFGGTPPPGSPWKISDPASGQGFESAVVYAIAKKLGLKKGDVVWVVVPFEQSFKPGTKHFDFDVNQVSYTADRAKSVDFSDSYYDVNQGLVGIKGKPITTAKSIADLKGYKLGAQLGTTSYDYITNKIKPSKKPAVYSTSNDVNSGLKAGQIDGIVVDLPTAFYITGSGQVANSVIVGQFPTEATPEHFGLVFEKGLGLVSCVNKALASLKSDGTLDKLRGEWLSNKGGAPVLK